MADKTKPCPQCNSTMTFRLGEFSCAQCGHSEEVVIEQAAKGPSGPGFQGGQQWSGQPAAAPSPYGAPPPGTLYTPGQLAGGRRIGSGGIEGNPIATHEYLLVGCLAFFIPLAGLVFGYMWSGQNRQGAEGCLTLAWVWVALNLLLGIIGFIIGFNAAGQYPIP